LRHTASRRRRRHRRCTRSTTGASNPGRQAFTCARRQQAAPTLIVNPPHAATGFDSQRIIYVRKAHQLEYFAHSEWVDTPARMIAPLIVAAVENSGMFRAVVLTPSAAAGDLRLDAEIMRMQHDFGSQPSRVQFTLRAYIVDNATRRVLAWREFDETVACRERGSYGGVVAANRAAADRAGTACGLLRRGGTELATPRCRGSKTLGRNLSGDEAACDAENAPLACGSAQMMRTKHHVRVRSLFGH
jgi:ABC-type uncharacterized transport system auxiliary subunit